MPPPKTDVRDVTDLLLLDLFLMPAALMAVAVCVVGSGAGNLVDLPAEIRYKWLRQPWLPIAVLCLVLALSLIGNGGGVGCHGTRTGCGVARM